MDNTENMALCHREKPFSDVRNSLKVYICCHEDDKEKYEEDLASMILSCGSWVSVWYRSADFCKNKELEHSFDAISKMQAFVVPVTEKFLGECPNIGWIEFHRAIKMGIPVFPILFDEGLEDVFIEQFGKIHFVKAGASEVSDSHVIRVLERFLRMLSPNGEYTTRIRQSTIMRFFLSYRKKDRVFAERIANEIYKNDFNGELSVWLDDYLIPGEEYTPEIRQAIHRSDLFVVAVTDNTNDIPNYVMNEEYPEAVNTGKRIMAVCEGESGTEAFRRRTGIAPVDISTVAEHINGIVKKSGKKSTSDPEQIFLRGIALLYGIDTVPDVAKGGGMILQAAESGYLSAQKKAVTMYLTGQGVSPNGFRALELMKKYKLFDEKEKNEPINRLSSYSLAFDDFKHRVLEDDSSIEECVRVYKEAAEYISTLDIDELLGGDDYYYTQIFYSRCCELVRHVLRFPEWYISKRESVIREWIDTHSIVTKLFSPYWGSDRLGSCFYAIADCYYLKGNNMKALEYAEQALDCMSESESMILRYNSEVLAGQVFSNLHWAELEGYCKKLMFMANDFINSLTLNVVLLSDDNPERAISLFCRGREIIKKTNELAFPPSYMSTLQKLYYHARLAYKATGQADMYKETTELLLEVNSHRNDKRACLNEEYFI